MVKRLVVDVQSKKKTKNNNNPKTALNHYEESIVDRRQPKVKVE